jgi:hypothetical protein
MAMVLAGNHVRVIEGMNKVEPILFFAARPRAYRRRIAVAVQHHFATQPLTAS